MPEQYQELSQKEFLTDYEDFAISPVAKYNYDQLPFADLPPRRFEQLCLKYCYKTYGMDRCTLYGYPGQKQYGLDILVQDEAEKYILYQCKRVAEFTGTDLAEAIKVFQEEKHQHKWHAHTSEFVLFSSNELIDTSFIEEFEKQRKLLHLAGIILRKLGSGEITELIKNDVEIIYEFFGEQWVKGFIKPEVYEPYLSGLVKLPEKKVYPEVRDYIPRSLTNPEKANQSLGYTFYDAQPLTAYLKEKHAENKPARVIIRSDAGLGKSKELDYLAYVYSNNGKLYPIIIRLKLYQGDLEKLIGAFYEYWTQLPKQRLLLLFDGLDEVPNNFLDVFLQQFNLLLQQYDRANIIVTARSSFSVKSVGDGVDERSLLKPQYLKPLERWEVEKYQADRGLSLAEIKKFDGLCHDRRLTDLLNNPFYLKNLIDLYQHPTLKFPNDRANAIAQIIALKMEEDRVKFPSMPPADRYLLFGKKLAVYLTLTGRNSLTENYLIKLTTLSITEIRYCSLFSCEENDRAISVYFEHNNFQEYLTASHLKELEWPDLQKLLFHEPAYLILKPRLVNTANYLFTLMDTDTEVYASFFNTLKTDNPELLLRFEKDKIDLPVRLAIFRHLIREGKKDGLYYLRGKYEVEDLLSFIEHAPDILGFIFAELTDPSISAIHKSCLLEILFNFHPGNITGNNRRFLHKTLKQIIESQETPSVHDIAIDVMTRQLFVDAADIRLCVRKCPNNHLKKVREAILKMIRAAGDEQYFNYVLASAPLLFPQDTSSSLQLGNDFLEIILSFLNAKTAIHWLKFAADNVNLLGMVVDNMYDPKERLVIQQINLKLANLYQYHRDDKILKGYMAFVSAIHTNLSESKWGNLALFFINTYTVERAFFTLLQEEDTVLYRSSIGADLANREVLDQLVNRVTQGSMPKDSLRLTRNFLHFFKRYELFNYLDEQIKAHFPDFFQPTVESTVNWHELNEQRTTRDYELLKSKSVFLAEAEMIFNEVARLKTDDDWFMLEYSEKAEIKKIVTNNIIFRMIERIHINGFDEFKIRIDEWKWDYFVFTQLTIYAIDQKKKLPDDWLAWLQTYVSNVMAKEVDFKKALKRRPDGGYGAINIARQIRSLFMEGLVVLPQNVLFDMPVFDTSGFTQFTPSPVKREFLFQKVIEKVEALAAFKQRILLNLTKKFPEPRVLETHCSICIYLQITEAIPLLVDHMQKKTTSAEVKDSLVTTLVKLGVDPGILAGELNQVRYITESWHWELFKPVFNEILKGNLIWDKAACLALAERSSQKQNTESRLKWRLIKAALKLGSVKSANQFFKFMGSTKSWSDYADIDAKDFEGIDALAPEKLIARCIKTLETSVLSGTTESPNMVERFVTQLIRQLAVKNYSLMLFAMQSYEKLIVKLIVQKPEQVHLRWYEKDLVSDYYIKAATFEDEEEVLQMISTIS
jgi:hypothetical protein